MKVIPAPVEAGRETEPPARNACRTALNGYAVSRLSGRVGLRAALLAKYPPYCALLAAPASQLELH
jgi:hypothetical protein